MARGTGEGGESTVSSLTELRAQLVLISRTLEREAHILVREPEVLPSHLHNMLYLDEGEEGTAGPLLARAREALAGRAWLRLTNRPPVDRSALVRVLHHGATVWALAWSPHGGLLASAGADGAVLVWEPATGRLATVLKADAGGVNALAWSRDAATLASGHDDGTVRLWDPVTGRQRDILDGHTDGVLALAWSPDGALLASGNADHTVRLWDPARGTQRCVLAGHTGHVYALAWSPDGVLLASGSDDGTVRLWDVAREEQRVVLQDTVLEERLEEVSPGLSTHGSAVYALAWSPDGCTLASGTRIGTLRLWETATGEAGAVAAAGEPGIPAVAWSRDGALLASGGGSGSLRLWDQVRGQGVSLPAGHSAAVRCLAWSPDGRTLASGSDDDTARLWASQALSDAATGKLRPVPEGPATAVFSLAWSPDGALLASGDADRSVWVWDVATGVPKDRIREFDGPVVALAWSPQGLLASPLRQQEAKVSLWDPDTGSLHTMIDNINPPVVLASSPGGVLQASGDLVGAVWVLEAAAGKIHAVLIRHAETKGHTNTKPIPCRVWALAWSPDGSLLASISAEATVLWDLTTGKERAVFEERNTTDGPDSTERSEAGRPQELRPDMLKIVYGSWGLAWSPDGALLASGGRDNLVRLWDPATEKPVAKLEGHTDHVASLAWAPSGAFVASGGDDNTLRLWDPTSGECRVVAHCLSHVRALQFSADGRILRAADSGAATGNRPIPYLFELCNIEIGPPVAPPVAPSARPPHSERHRPRWAFWRQQ